jgi:hypothetical protein
LTCNFGTLVSGESRKVHITSETTKGSCSRIENTASVSTSNDGSAQASDSVTVTCYTFLGFSSPVPNSMWQAGRTIPVKFRLGYVNGTPLSDADAQAIASSCRAKVLLTGPNPSTSTVSGPICASYDAVTHRFAATLSVPRSLRPGPYQLVVNVYDAASPTHLDATGQEILNIKH